MIVLLIYIVRRRKSDRNCRKIEKWEKENLI